MTTSLEHSSGPTGSPPEFDSVSADLLKGGESSASKLAQESVPSDITTSRDQLDESAVTGVAAIPKVPQYTVASRNGGHGDGSYFQPLAEWVGWVTSIDDEVFTAEVESKENPGLRETVEFELSELSDHDRGSVYEGAFFYWSVGYFTLPTGQKFRASQVRFKRLPKRPKTTVERARRESMEFGEPAELDLQSNS